VTDRTRTGFLRDHDPACRPLQLRPQSTRRDSNPRHPVCKTGGLTADLLVGVVASLPRVGRRGVEPRHPAVSARCRHRLAHALGVSGGGLGSARTSPCRVSTGRSAVRDSRPWDRGWRSRLGPAAGIEPAASRLRGERPCHQDLAGTIVERSGVVGGTRTLIADVAHRHPRRWTTTTGGLCAMDAREGLSPPFHGLQPCASILGHRAVLPGRGSNPRLPGNSRTSCRSTTWHGPCVHRCWCNGAPRRGIEPRLPG
jgi:hypothetical protein